MTPDPVASPRPDPRSGPGRTPALDTGLTALRALGGFFVLRTSPDPDADSPVPPSARPAAPDPSAPGPGSPASAAPVRFPRPRLPTLAQAYAPEPLPEPRHDHRDRRDRGDHGDYGDQRDPLTVRVRRVGAALGVPEPRVAASVAQQGLAARLWSVSLGCAALYGAVPDLDPGLLRWDPEGSAPDDLWLERLPGSLPGDAADLARIVLDGHLVPLNGALRARYGPAAGLLWGNAASALVGAARELDRWARRHGRTDVSARARGLAADLLRHPLLAGAGTLAGTGPAFRRRSCCLYYRVPGGGLCGDCCFTRPPRTSPEQPPGGPVRLYREIPGQA